jgi:uncharacterized membrane protein
MHQQKIDAARWIISIVILLGAGIMGGLAIPLWHGKIAPNKTYGVRTKRTLADPELWYRANAVVGRNLAIFSIVLACITVAFHFTLARTHFVLSANLLAAVLLIGIAAITIHGIRIR